MRRLAPVALLLLSGCNFAPQYRQPVAPISDRFPTPDGLTSKPATHGTDLGWQDYFQDARLRALMGRALVRNRDLAQSLARIEQARARYRIQETQRLPTLEADAGATRSRQPLAALGGGAGAGGPAAIELSQYSGGVGVSAFELDLWGRVRNLAAAEKARYLASVQGARAFRLSLIAQVATVYYDIRAGQERIDLAERTLAGRRESVRLALKRLDAGVTSTVDHDQAVLLLTQAETELADLRRTTEQSRNLLEVLVGGPITDPLPEGAALDSATQVRAVDPGLPSELLTARPDVLEAELNLKAANADIGAAKAEFFPRITLTGNYGFVSPALDALFKSGNRSWSFGGAANLPIFDWGRRAAQVRLSRAQADELTAAYQRTVQGAFQEVANALVARRRLAEQRAAQEQTLAAQRRLAKAARSRYDNGIAIYLEVLDAERNLFAAAQQLLRLRALELQNSVNLYVAMGGRSSDG